MPASTGAPSAKDPPWLSATGNLDWPGLDVAHGLAVHDAEDPLQDVHGRVADEPGHERVGGPLEHVDGRSHLLDGSRP